MTLALSVLSARTTGDAGWQLAHGIGGQKDLPLPLGLTVAGAVAALVLSFTVLALAWRRPRYDGVERGRVAPEPVQRVVDSSAFAVVLRVVGMVFFAFTVFTAVFGRDTIINPFFGIVFIWLWVGIVPLSLLFGPFWKAISPVRTINLGLARLMGSDPDEGMRTYSERLGYWPAAIGLFAFVWLELVDPSLSSEIGPVRLWCALYVALMLVGGAVFGTRFYERCDPFEVYSSLVGKLSVWGRREGRVIVLSPLANVATTTVRPGLVGVVGVLFGSTAYDSFRESPPWVGFVQDSDVNGVLLSNLALVVFCVVATGVFALGCVLTGVDERTRRSELPNAFAHSVLPIVVGYIVAHYLTYFLEVGTTTLIRSSDPLSNGSDIIGTADWSSITWFSYHPQLLASVKVAAVVLGHVVAAVVAHDRAMSLLPRRHQLTGQLPLLAAMVAFTAGGLFLLFSG